MSNTQRVQDAPRVNVAAADDKLLIDGATTRSIEVRKLIESRRALQASAAAGVSIDEIMTPASTAQAIRAQDFDRFANVAALLADTSLVYGSGASQVQAGDIVRTREEGFAYKVAPASATDHPVETAGGVKLYLVPSLGRLVSPVALGAGSAALQAAFETAPMKSFLNFPATSYGTTGVARLERYVNLDLQSATIVADMTGAPSGSALEIDIDDVGAGAGVGDVRNMVITGGSIITTNGGNAAIDINPDGVTDARPHFGTVIEKGNHSGNLRTIRLGAANPAGDTNFNTLRDLTLGNQNEGGATVDLDGCADGNRLLDSLLYGPGVAVRVNLEEGAFNTTIANNGLVTRDGALLITDGSRVGFFNNQCEQQGGVNANGATVLVQGLDYISAGNLFLFNNFGGGADVNYSIQAFNMRGAAIDYNQFNPAAICDIRFDADSGLDAKHNVVGPNNVVRGTRPVRGTMTDASRRLIIEMATNARNNRGVWRPASHIAFEAGWSGSSDFAFMVDEWGIIHFEGSLVGGTATAGTGIGVLPLGCRPRVFVSAPFVAETGAFGFVNFNSSGGIVVGSTAASPSQGINLTHVSFPVIFLPESEYNPGPA